MKDRLHRSYKRMKATSAASEARDRENAKLRTQLNASKSHEDVLQRSERSLQSMLAISRTKLEHSEKKRDKLQASIDLLQRQRNHRSADEYKALEAEIDMLRQEKEDRTLGLEEKLTESEALEDENGRLNEEVDVLRGQIGDMQASLRAGEDQKNALEASLHAEEEQKKTLEVKHKELLKSFEDYKRRLRKMSKE